MHDDCRCDGIMPDCDIAEQNAERECKEKLQQILMHQPEDQSREYDREPLTDAAEIFEHESAHEQFLCDRCDDAGIEREHGGPHEGAVHIGIGNINGVAGGIRKLDQLFTDQPGDHLEPESDKNIADLARYCQVAELEESARFQVGELAADEECRQIAAEE